MDNTKIVGKKELPETVPPGICIRSAGKYFGTCEKDMIKDISQAGVENIIKNVLNGTFQSRYLSLAPQGRIDATCLHMEQENQWIFLQICNRENQVCYAPYNKEHCFSDEEPHNLQ